MPPTPAMRCSPGREHKMENAHKRGQSFESGLHLKAAKDDDLALFKDMQNRERDSFLLHTADDFEDTIAKLRYFTDYKLGINIPVRGESSDLLNADGNKNDYDWLLTPPETPLFSSLDDDEEPKPVNLAPRGRPRSQPVAISRSSMSEKTQRSNRSSSSPHRLSPSPRSSSSVSHSRGRSSSAPQSSASAVQRPTTPSRRSPTPPNKPSTPTPRSTTPTLRRMSTGSGGQTASMGRRGASPVKTSRGNSASPKLRGWQSNLPGFSSDVPPNLRTSLSDRPASYTRGSSPASRNGGDSLPRYGRQSISPTVSRSARSSHGHEQDRFSSYSRGSAASSHDDDVDSLHSATVGISGSPTARKNGLVANNSAMAFSKKPSRSPYANSAPKRSFDSALRQMDHHKTPQNMFRPLLSSVPSTTFYIGKASSLHRPMFSRNSSLTTSSNASSDQGASVVPDMEGVDHAQNVLAAHWEKQGGPETQEEIFIFDKVDDITESRKLDGGVVDKVDTLVLEKPGENFCDMMTIAAASESLCAAGNNSDIDIYMMAICCRCGNRFRIVDVDGTADICQDCVEKDELISTGESRTSLLVTQRVSLQSEATTGTGKLSDDEPLKAGLTELPEKCVILAMVNQHEKITEEGSDCLPESCAPQSLMDEANQHLADQHFHTKQDASSSPSNGDCKFRQSQCTAHPNLRVENPEGAGISVLLQRSGSSKWPVVQGRVFSATSILCSEPSYTRDNMNAMKRSISRDGGSASSSVDLGSSRQSEPRVQHQLSNRRAEIDNVRIDTYEKAQSSGSLYSGVPLSAYEAVVLSKSKEEENLHNSAEDLGYEASVESMLATTEHGWSLGGTELCATPSSSRQDAIADEVLHSNDCLAKVTCNPQLLSHPESDQVFDTSAADFRKEDCSSSVNAEKDIQSKEQKFQDKEVPSDITDSSEEDYVSNGTTCQNDISNAATDSSCVVNLEQRTDHDGAQGSHADRVHSLDSSTLPNSYECSVSIMSEMETSCPALESSIIDRAVGVYEESTITVEGRHMSRSLTLEEATDTILFCSSIIHDLAYKAATIGMEKQLALPEIPRPTITISGKSVFGQQDAGTMSLKRTPKSQKSRRKRLEAGFNAPVCELGDNVSVQESMPANPEVTSKPDSMKPPKLESKCNCTVM